MSQDVGNFPAETGSDLRGRFDALMRAEGPRIYSLAVRLAGNAADGQDLAAETFVRAFKSFGAFRGEAAFATWVYRICVNTWKNRLRAQKRRYFWSHFSFGPRQDDEDGAVLELPAPEPGPDRLVDQEDRRRRIEDALERLSDEDRGVVVMRDVDDRSYEDIAQFLGIPLGTVKSRLARARLRLRTLLKDIL
jgi:RNA polymerase sigma factor (sigma-70 family)